MRRISSPVFVGRAEELEALDAALAAARAGEASHRPGERRGRHRQDAPAGGVRGARERRRRARVDRQLHRARRRRAAARAARRDPAPARARARSPTRSPAVLGPARAVLDPAAPDNQARRLELVLAMLGRLGELAPAVIAIEDLHWADRSTRDLLAFLIRSLREERIVLVATYRSDELHRRHPLRAFLSRARRRRRADRAGALRRGRAHPARDRDPRRGARPRAGRASCSRARRATRSWPRSCSPPADPSCPRRCARRCWSASSGCRTARRRRCASPRAPERACPTACSPRRRGCRSASWRTRCARR